MRRWNREWLYELKQFFLEHGRWVDGLFQVLFVLEDVKPGIHLQQNSRRELKRLANMLSWFGLWVSRRHGGYATRNESLYRRWNKIFAFRMDAESFLGYPRCCVADHDSQETGLRFFLGLYSFIKQVRANRLSRPRFRAAMLPLLLLNYFPCSMECQPSLKQAKQFEGVLRKYRWLVGDLLPEFYLRKIRGLLQVLESLPSRLSSSKRLEEPPAPVLGISPTDYVEVLNDAPEFRANLRQLEHLLVSQS